jgi:hypothetical protein
MRGPFEGVLNILRFNWPMFVATTMGIVIASGVALSAGSPVVRVGGALVAAGLAVGTLVSLVVSHLVYDRSDLYRFQWLARARGERPLHRAVFCQTGFDESSALLRAGTPGTVWTLLDHYAPVTMTEPSIRRARRRCPPAPGTAAAPHGAWPTRDGEADLVVGMLAVHELRRDDERTAWFGEARRATAPGGRVVVVEHVRDLANVLVFGPGALHFHAVSTWRRSWEQAQLRLHDEFRLTPWVRVFVLVHA